jgi:gliding motility-associated-like protein
MRLTLRIYLFLLVFSSAFNAALNAQGSCITADAGADQQICLGDCGVLFANVTGTRQTNIYSTIPVPYAPYSFTGGNPVLVNLDDLWSPLITIPFCFDFYGNTYTQLVIGTNGIVTFDASQANGTCPWTINAAIPNPGLPLNSIMAPFHDIDPTIVTANGATSINWNVYGTAPCRSFVINWNDVGMYGANCGGLTSTSQVVLHESTNVIDIFIKDKFYCNSWNNGAGIEGIQNATGTFATVPSGRNYPTNWSANNDGVQFRPAGAANFSVAWFDSSNNMISNLLAQQVCPTQTSTYTLQFTNTSCNGNPVTITDTVVVNVIQSNLTTTDTATLPSCNNACNGAITIFASNGVPPYNYNWVPNVGNGPTVTNLCAGLYVCTVTDATGCSNQVIVNLVPTPPFTMSVATTPSQCNDSTGTALVNIVGGIGPFTTEWSNGDTGDSISGLPAGSYQVVITDSAGCMDSILAHVAQGSLQLTSQSTQLVCNGDCNAQASVTVLTGIPPFTYSWAPSGGSNPLAINLCAGIYLCAVTDSTGCVGTAVVPISSPPPLVVTPSANQTICLGESTVVSATATGGTPPYVYSWNNGLLPVASNTITPLQTTIYSVEVADSNGCISYQQTTLVKVNGGPTAGFTSLEGTCPPVGITFTNTTDTAVTYLWNFGDPSSGANDTSSLFSPTHVYNTGGNYTVTLIAINAYGCADTISIPNAVQVPDAPYASISTNTSLLTSLDPVILVNNATLNAISYLIYFGDGDSLLTTSTGPYEHTYDTLGIFTITLIAWSSDGCPDTTWLTINIEEPTTFFLPNAFTPNGDGKNDFFMPYGINVKQIDFLIFNRWGELIFESHDMSDGWDGTCKGIRVLEDVYVWKIHYTDNLDQLHDQIGHVSLIR